MTHKFLFPAFKQLEEKKTKTVKNDSESSLFKCETESMVKERLIKYIQLSMTVCYYIKARPVVSTSFSVVSTKMIVR